MHKSGNDMNLSRLSDIIASETGLHFPKDRFADLQRVVDTAAPELGYTDPDEFITSLSSNPPSREQLETLVHYLTVGETYFFRDSALFKLFDGEGISGFDKGQGKRRKKHSFMERRMLYRRRALFDVNCHEDDTVRHLRMEHHHSGNGHQQQVPEKKR